MSQKATRVSLAILGTVCIAGGAFISYRHFLDKKLIKAGNLPNHDMNLPPSSAGTSELQRDAALRWARNSVRFDSRLDAEEDKMGMYELRDRAARLARGDVLEVGVGTGRNIAFYDGQYTNSLTFIDLTKEMVEHAVAKVAVRFAAAGQRAAVARTDREDGAFAVLPYGPSIPAPPSAPDNDTEAERASFAAAAAATAAAAAAPAPPLPSPEDAMAAAKKVFPSYVSETLGSFVSCQPLGLSPAPAPSAGAPVVDIEATASAATAVAISAPAYGPLLESRGLPTPYDPSGAASEGAALAAARAATSPPAAFLIGSAEKLPFPAHSFDTVVDTFGLCSYADPKLALREMARVCKPDGAVVLLEHGRGDGPMVNLEIMMGRERHRKVWGCDYGRDIREIVKATGVEIISVRKKHRGTTQLVVARPAGGTALAEAKAEAADRAAAEGRK